MAINAEIRIPSGQQAVVVTQNTQLLEVTQNAANIVQVVDRQSIVGISAASDKHYSHIINVGDWVANGAEWDVTISHSLSKFPSITVVDSFGQTQYPNTMHVDALSISSRGKFSGTVYFN